MAASRKHTQPRFFGIRGGKSEDKEPAEPFCKDGRQSHSDHCHWLVEAKCRGSPGLYHENWINKSGSFPVPFATSIFDVPKCFNLHQLTRWDIANLLTY
jgi:hypothetical protein